jgi:hypothetical protein
MNPRPAKNYPLSAVKMASEDKPAWGAIYSPMYYNGFF